MVCLAKAIGEGALFSIARENRNRLPISRPHELVRAGVLIEYRTASIAPRAVNRIRRSKYEERPRHDEESKNPHSATDLRVRPVTDARAAFMLTSHTLNRGVLGERAATTASRIARDAQCVILESGDIAEACDLVESLVC